MMIRMFLTRDYSFKNFVYKEASLPLERWLCYNFFNHFLIENFIIAKQLIKDVYDHKRVRIEQCSKKHL